MPRLATSAPDPSSQNDLPFETLGTNPEDTWVDALTLHGEGPGTSDKGGEWSTRCPAHTDSHPSLRWRIARDGRVLFHCHAGCEFEEVLHALKLDPWALQRVKTLYTYCDRVGNPVFRVVRTMTTKGKVFRQEHYNPVAQEWAVGRGDTPDLIWRLDQAIGWAQSAPPGATLYLTEGEKDAITLASDVEPLHFVTTAPGGAAKWSDELTRQVVEIVNTGTGLHVQIVADADVAGLGRARTLVRTLSGFDLNVTATTVDATAGFKDISELIDRVGREWRRHMVDLTADPMAQPWDETGGLFLDTHPGVPGNRAFHHTIGRGRQAETVIRAVCAVIPKFNVVNEHKDRIDGWVCDIYDPYHTEPRTLMVPSESLSTKPRYDTFRSEVGLPPAPNANGLAFHEQLDAFLRFHSRGLPYAKSLPRAGWNRSGNDWALVDGDTGRVVLGVGYTGHQATGLVYGTDVSPEETARRVAEALKLREYAESGPLMAWVSAYLLQPVLWSLGYRDRPVLAVTGRSGVGKSRNPYLGFAGLVNTHETTPAGLTQMLRTRSLMGLDDQRMSDVIGDAIRQATAQDTMAARGTPEQNALVRKAEGWIVYSGEDQPWIDDRAHLERTVHLVLQHNVQGRTWDDGTSQWPIASQYMGKGLGTECAGTLARELNKHADTLRSSLLHNTGHRGIAGYQMCLIGAKILADWLRTHGYETEASSFYAGAQAWVERAEKRASARFIGGVGQMLTDTVIPAFLSWAPNFAISPCELAVRRLEQNLIQDAVRLAYSKGYRSACALDKPPVIVIRCEDEVRVLWNSTLLARWIADQQGGQRSRAIREGRPELLTATSLASQTAAVKADPMWTNVLVRVDKQRVRYTMASAGISEWLLLRVADTGSIG